MTEDELILQHIEFSQHRSGLGEVRLKIRGVRVWALVGYAMGAGGDIATIAGDYDLPEDVVLAARAYYRRHRAILNDRVLANTPECFDVASMLGNWVEEAELWPSNE